MSSTTLNSMPTAQEITSQSSSNFTLAFWFLSKERRQGMIHFYALSRLLDDAVDEHEPEEARHLLEFWRQEIEHCYGGQPTHGVTQAMQKTIEKFSIDKKYLELLWEGCQWDLSKTRYHSLQAMTDYCYRVAATIGLVCMKIFGVSGPEAEQAAIELGYALQFTNILRDVQEDGQRGRIYLPLEDLERYKIKESELISGPMNRRLQLLFKLQADRSETHFYRAFTLMKKLPGRPLVAAWMMGKVYHALLKKIRHKKYDIYSQKIKLSRTRRLGIALAQLGRIMS